MSKCYSLFKQSCAIPVLNFSISPSYFLLTLSNLNQVEIVKFPMKIQRPLFLLIALIISVVVIQGCSSSSKIKDGNIAFLQKSYILAANLFKTEYKQESEPKNKARKAVLFLPDIQPLGKILRPCRYNAHLDVDMQLIRIVLFVFDNRPSI